MTPPAVVLTEAERFQLAHLAAFRCSANLYTRHAHGKKDRTLGEEFRGIGAEYAAAKHLGVFLPLDLDRQRRPDAGRVHVRSVADGKRRLLIREDDPLDEPFLLVEYQQPVTFVLVGWIYPRAARREDWRFDPHVRGAAWFVPREALLPIAALPEGGR